MLTIQLNGEAKQVNGRIEVIIRKLLQAEQLITATQRKPVKYIVHCGALPEDVDLEIPVVL